MEKGSDRFLVRFWGVRGSYPTSDMGTLHFGGHTSCVEVRAADQRLIFDAGTGIIPLGKQVLKERHSRRRFHIFFSHTHHDHLLGFYFFEPLLRPDTEAFVFGPYSPRKTMVTTLKTVMDSEFFPIELDEVKARIKIYSLKGGESIRLGGNFHGPRLAGRRVTRSAQDEVVVFAHKSLAHPKNGVLLYRIEHRGKSVVYATDIEERPGGYPEVIEFARGADLLIHDAQYLRSEYFSRTDPRRGWGHSTLERAAEVARKARVQRLLLFHHEPSHDDRTVGEMERLAQRLFPRSAAAYEGMKIALL
ncbi:MAG: MBL fold metallo-hydrolase [Deltaproteobacteria bacterium]|nr:MBL fold metallo-hydrolase [Deltaproteobacteria bacterium]